MLDNNDISRLKEIFVTRQECDDTIHNQDNRFANDDKRLAVIETYQKITLAVLSVVGAGVVTIVLNIFSGGMA